MAALKVGDVTTCIVLSIHSGLARVMAHDMNGIIRGPDGTRAVVGEHLRIRIVDFDSGGSRFIASRLGGL